MEIGEERSGARPPGTETGEAGPGAPGEGRQLRFGPQRVGEILGEWQQKELRIARGFAECRGLSAEQLEDLYQETALALYRRPYASEEHLRNALRTGIKQRALRLHRDERRHGQILQRSAPGMHVIEQAREAQSAPEPAVLADEDRLIAREFTTELTEKEKRVFGGLAEGLQYRAIATALGIPVNEARNLARSCERKRERFQLLYDTGRLCGYRALTIQALQNGQSTSEELAERAFAHLESCAHCRLEHKTNARRLRRSFREQSAALLPPLLAGHLGWLTRLGVRARLLLHRLGLESAPAGPGGIRERAVSVLAGGGVGAKVAAGLLAAGVIAGGAVATHVLQRAPLSHRHVAPAAAAAPPTAPTVQTPSELPAASASTRVRPRVDATPHSRPRGVGTRQAAGARRTTTAGILGQREPGGFAYLGVPASTGTPSGSARVASAAEGEAGGGPFSP